MHLLGRRDPTHTKKEADCRFQRKEGRQRALDPRGQAMSAGQAGQKLEAGEATAHHPSGETSWLKYSYPTLQSKARSPAGDCLVLWQRRLGRGCDGRERTRLLLSLAAPAGLFAVADRVAGGARGARRGVVWLASSDSGAGGM